MGKRIKRNLKVCTVECQWEDCQWVATINPTGYQAFSDHIKVHADEFVSRLQTDRDPHDGKPVGCCCMWRSCAWEGCGDFMDLLRHVMYHGYHALLKALGKLVQTNLQLATCRIEMEDPYSMLLNTIMFTCQWDGCLTEYACPNKFYRHVEKHVMESVVTNEGDTVTKVKCSWEKCDNVFRNKYKLKEHVRVHTHEKLIACPDCGGMFANQTKLLDHLSRQNPEAYESFQCSHCLKRCASERLLRDHMRHHVNYLKCPHCDMTCPNPGSLKYHIAYRHTDERPFTCAMCEQSFKSHSDLVRHEESHLEKSYLCDVEGCTYTTKTQHCLRRHIRIMHSNTEKRYICHICNSEYSRGFGLTKHLKKKHNFSWPSGHPRFRYIQYEDGFYRLQMVRFESVELTKRLQQSGGDGEDEDVEYDGEDYDTRESIHYADHVGEAVYSGDNSVVTDATGESAAHHSTVYFETNDMNGDELRDNILYTSVAYQTQVEHEVTPSVTTSSESSNYVFVPQSGHHCVKGEKYDKTTPLASTMVSHPQFINTVNSETHQGVLRSMENISKLSTDAPAPVSGHPESLSSAESHIYRPDLQDNDVSFEDSVVLGTPAADNGGTGGRGSELVLQPKPVGYDKTVMAQLVAFAKKQSYQPCAEEKAIDSSIVNDLYERLKSSMGHNKTDDNDDAESAVTEQLISSTTTDNTEGTTGQIENHHHQQHHHQFAGIELGQNLIDVTQEIKLEVVNGDNDNDISSFFNPNAIENPCKRSRREESPEPIKDNKRLKLQQTLTRTNKAAVEASTMHNILAMERDNEEKPHVSSTTGLCDPLPNNSCIHQFHEKNFQEQLEYSTATAASCNIDNTKDIVASHILLSLNNETT